MQLNWLSWKYENCFIYFLTCQCLARNPAQLHTHGLVLALSFLFWQNAIMKVWKRKFYFVCLKTFVRELRCKPMYSPQQTCYLPCKYCVWQPVEVSRQWPLARISLFLCWPVSCGGSGARAHTLPWSRWTLANLEVHINFAWDPLHQNETGGGRTAVQHLSMHPAISPAIPWGSPLLF